MAVLNFSDALMEARRKAQVQGRPLSQGEMEGITTSYSKTAGDRAAQQKQLQLAEESQENQKEQFAQSMELSGAQMEMQNEQFSKTLEMNMEQNRLRGEEAIRSLDLQEEGMRAQMAAAEAARRSQETSSYVTAGSSLLLAIVLACTVSYSDKRLKKNIRPITEEIDPMSLLKNDEILGVFYEWKNEDMGTETEIGFTAQMFEKIPGLTMEINGIMCLRYDRITALLWEQNRALMKRIEKLEEKDHV